GLRPGYVGRVDSHGRGRAPRSPDRGDHERGGPRHGGGQPLRRTGRGHGRHGLLSRDTASTTQTDKREKHTMTKRAHPRSLAQAQIIAAHLNMLADADGEQRLDADETNMLALALEQMR